jgi:hypothetical protein
MKTICDDFEDNGTLARYVANVATIDEAESFEDHYLTCERCQRSVDVGMTVRAVSTRQPRKRRRIVIPALAAAAIAAVFVGVRWNNASHVRALGVLDRAPIYLGEDVRSSDGSATAFADAMNAYVARDYRAASQKLATLSDRSELVVPFFRGASLLMLRDGANAEEAFTRVIEGGESSYRDEAMFYRAKARLLRNDVAAARNDLQQVAQRSGTLQFEATALLQKLSN